MQITIKSKNNRYFRSAYMEENKPDDISICVKTKDKITYFPLFNIEEETSTNLTPLHVRYKGIEYTLWCY